MTKLSTQLQSFVEYGCLFSEPNYLQLLVDFMLLLEIAKAFQISIYHCISRGYDVIDADKYLPSTILPDSDEKTRQENIEIYKSMIKDLEQRKKLLSSVKLRIFFGYLLHLFAVAFHIAWYCYFTSRMYSLTGKVHSELYVNYMRYGDSNMLFECEVDYTSQVNIFNSFRSNDNDDSFKEHNDLVKVTCMKTLVPYINYMFFMARILIALQIVSIIIEESFKAYFFADALENRSSDYINDVIYGLANGYYGYYDVKLIATSFKVKDKNEEIGTFKYLKIRGFSSHLMYLPVTDSVDHFENNDPKFDFNVKIPEGEYEEEEE
ncbi:MAG: hypothetical protein MHMPM18_002214 [Marteilia pararefringens]